LNDSGEAFLTDWDKLVAHVREEQSELVLLPEMAFYPWMFWRKRFDAGVWKEAVEAHKKGLTRLKELTPACVLGTRPAESWRRRVNQGFFWSSKTGYIQAHTKYYLPDEEGYWEASWYSRGNGEFKAFQTAGIKIGFLICTDIWFFERSRQYGKQGAHLIVCPRATPRSTADKWIVAGRAAAVVSGAYCLSSNRTAPEGHKADLGGAGWVLGPNGGVIGVTSQEKPFLTFDLDLNKAEEAKNTYPRYVAE
jgi:N-carbamoylputrescine amidase